MKAFFFGGEQDGEVIDIEIPSDYIRFIKRATHHCSSNPTRVTEMTQTIQEYRRDFDYKHQLVYRCMDDNGEG